MLAQGRDGNRWVTQQSQVGLGSAAAYLHLQDKQGRGSQGLREFGRVNRRACELWPAFHPTSPGDRGRHTEAVCADCHWLTWLTLALSEPQAGGFKERKWDTILPWRRAHLCDQRLDFGRAWCEVGGCRWENRGRQSVPAEESLKSQPLPRS